MGRDDKCPPVLSLSSKEDEVLRLEELVERGEPLEFKTEFARDCEATGVRKATEAEKGEDGEVDGEGDGGGEEEKEDEGTLKVEVVKALELGRKEIDDLTTVGEE